MSLGHFCLGSAFTPGLQHTAEVKEQLLDVRLPNQPTQGKGHGYQIPKKTKKVFKPKTKMVVPDPFQGGKGRGKPSGAWKPKVC